MFQGFYWTSIIMLHTVERCIEWLHEVPDDKGGVVFFKWCRGKNAHGLCFGARSNFVDELDILGDGVLVVAGETAPMQWSAARVTPHKPLAGLARFSVGAVLIGRGEHDWDPHQWKEVADDLIKHNVRIVMMQAECPIRGCGEHLVQTIRKEHINAEHIGEAFKGHTQFVLLGDSSGFDGDLSIPNAEAPNSQSRRNLKKAVLGSSMDLQDTLSMTLPFVKSRYSIIPRSVWACLWLRGAENRSQASKHHRYQTRIMRKHRSAQRYEEEYPKPESEKEQFAKAPWNLWGAKSSAVAESSEWA